MADAFPAGLLPEGLTPGVLLLVLIAALAAGWIDAVVGGGGLLQLPALLLVPGLSPVQALATNKLASVFGLTTSAVTYQLRGGLELRPGDALAPGALVLHAGGVVGSAVGAEVGYR